MRSTEPSEPDGKRWAMTMRRTRAAAALLAASAITGGTGWWLIDHGDSREPRAAPTTAEVVVMGEGLDLLSGDSVEDWVRYGSFVAVVTVTGEHAAPIAQEDLDRGEGMIDRSIDLRIDKTLWSRPGVNLPASVTTTAAGWTWGDHAPERRTSFALGDRPRLEVDQQYVIAFARYPGLPAKQADACGDQVIEPAWGPVGSGGAVPVSAGVLGVGEFEGTAQTLDQALEAAAQARSGPNSTFRDLLVGARVELLAPLLTEAAGRTTQEEIPAPAGC